jgi:hypothetical protein
VNHQKNIFSFVCSDLAKSKFALTYEQKYFLRLTFGTGGRWGRMVFWGAGL